VVYPLLAPSEGYAYAIDNPVLHVDPDGAATYADCAAGVRAARREAAYLFAKMRKKDCKIPNINCICTRQGEMGEYDSLTKDIAVFYDPDYSTRDSCRRTAKHEIVHAFDDCFGMDPTDCYQIACSEITAMCVSGECRLGSVNRGDQESAFQCVARRAERAVNKHDECKPGMRYVRAMLMRCFQVREYLSEVKPIGER
jgi:hypothetical protein